MSKYKTFFIADFESGKRITFDRPVQKVYFGLDGEHKPIASFEVIERAALDEAVALLKEAKNKLTHNLFCEINISEIFPKDLPKCTCEFPTKNKIDEFLKGVEG